LPSQTSPAVAWLLATRRLYGLFLSEWASSLTPCRFAVMPQVLWALAGMSKSSLPERKQAAVEIIDKCAVACCTVLSYACMFLSPRSNVHARL